MKGEPVRYVPGHHLRLKRVPEPPEPNPSGLCMCGCGLRTALAPRTELKRGYVRGKPVRYIPGHYCRLDPPFVDPETECWIWQGKPGSHGRGQVTRVIDGVKTVTTAYRATYEEHIGSIPKGHDLHHECGNPMCVNPEHLEPMLRSEHGALHGARS